MPQLDKVTFLSQFFWLCFFYLGFYFFIYKFFLPKMSRILKFRSKKMNQSHQGVTSTLQENKKVGESYETILANGFNTSRTCFENTLLQSTTWVEKSSAKLNQTHLQEMNNTYIKTLGENSASEVFACNLLGTFGGVSSDSAITALPKKKPILFFSLFLRKIQLLATSHSLVGEKMNQTKYKDNKNTTKKETSTQKKR